MAWFCGAERAEQLWHLEELVAGDQLLDNHASHGDHGEAPVVDLLRLHGLEARRVLGLETERVEHKVAW